MKIAILFLLLFDFFTARILSAYNSNSLFMMSFPIKHKIAGYIFIGKTPTTKYNFDRSRMLYQGLFLHILTFLALAFSIYVLFFCPTVENEVFLIGSGYRYGFRSIPIIASTLNDASAFLVALSILLIEMIILFLEGIKATYNDTSSSTSTLIIGMILNIVMVILLTFLFMRTIFQLFSL